MTIFCIVVGIAFFIIALVNQRMGYYIYLASLPLLPAYIAIPLVSGGAGISLHRILTAELALLIFCSAIICPRLWIPVFRRVLQWRLYVIAFACLFFAKFASTIYMGNQIGLVYLLDELLEVLVIVLLTVRHMKNFKSFSTILILVISALLLTEGIVYVEQIMQRPVLADYIVVEVRTVGIDIMQGFERLGYRSIALFDNPLSLAEFLCLGVPFLIGAYMLRRARSAVILAAVLLIPAVLFTGSRSGLLGLFVSVVGTGYIYLESRLSPYSRPLHWLMSGMFILAICAVAFYSIMNPESSASTFGSLFDTDIRQTTSSMYRLLEYSVISSEIFSNSTFGLLGAGMQSNTIQNLGIPLDSYFLRVLIEGGVIGLIAFLVMLVAVVQKVMSHSTYEGLPYQMVKGVRLFMISFIVVFISYKFFVSMTFNNVYFYLVSAMLMVLSADRLRWTFKEEIIENPARPQ